MLRISNIGVIVAYVLIAMILGGNAAFTYKNAQRLREETNVVQHSHEVIEAIDAVGSAIKDAETGQRGFLITQDEGYLPTYQEGIQRIRGALDQLALLVRDQPRQIALVQELKGKVAAKLAELQETLDVLRDSGFEKAREQVRTGQGRRQMNETLSITTQMTGIEQTLLANRSAQATRTFQSMVWSSIATTAATVLLFAVAVLMIRRNIAARARATEALAEQGDLLRTTLASIVEGIIVTDADGRVTFLNPVAERMTGCTLADAQGLLIPAVLDVREEETRAPIVSTALQALRTGSAQEGQSNRLLLAKDGRERAIEDSAAPLVDADGTIVGAVLAFRDVTRQHSDEKDLADAKAYAECIIDTIPDPFVILDSDLRIRSANLSYLETFRTSEAQVAGKPFFEAGGGNWDVDAVLRLQAEADATSGAVHTEIDHVVPGSGSRILRLSARRLRGTGEHADLMLLAIRDVTGSRTNERRIKQLLAAELENASRLRQIATASLTLNAAHSQEMVLTVLREEAMRILSFDEAEVVLGPEEPREAAPDGSTYLSAPLHGRDAELLGWIQLRGTSGRAGTVSESDESILRQLAHVASVAMENARLYEELREGDRRKDEFLATLAHELRNPLAPVRNSVQVLRSSQANEDDRDQAMTTIERQLQLLVRLVDDLLDVSRITRGKVALKREHVELADVVGQALEISRPIVNSSGNSLVVELPQERVELYVDPSRLAQVLSNLLNNAAKYTERGGHIRLTSEREGDEVRISVSDDGIGIPAEMVPHIFDMFWQLEHALERAQGGLGIGLTIVRQLVDLHGGTVEARSAGIGRGSEFIVRLPVKSTPPATLPRNAPGPKHARVDGALPAPTGLRILVVDDNQDSAESLALLLRLQGHVVRTAHDGMQALAADAEFDPDLVLLDIGLPRMNGYEAARALRERRGKDVTIAAMTGFGQAEDRRRSKEAGFDHHLVKPIDPPLLRHILATLPVRG
jgi:PAS domain S-box-containing protein